MAVFLYLRYGMIGLQISWIKELLTEEQLSMEEKNKFEIFHYHSKAEKIVCRILQVILVLLLSFYIYILAEADPEALNIQGIALLVTIACLIFGPVLVFETWLTVGIIKSGASLPNVLLLIGICIYINSVLNTYGLFGAWILFRKRA